MDIEEFRESGDEQDDQEFVHEDDESKDQEEHNEQPEEEQRNELEEQDEDVDILENEKQEEVNVHVENRPENCDNTNRKSLRKSRAQFRAQCKAQSKAQSRTQSRAQSKAQSKTVTPQNQSLALNNLQPKRWRSANAFVNFVQDFKEDYPDLILTGRNIFQTCGERWKNMTDEQKQPYIAAANTVKRMKNQKIGESIDQHCKKSVTRVSKRKADTKRKETSQKRSKANNQDKMSNLDTDTATTIVSSSISDPDSP